jgi:hypothetical protein
MSGRLTVVLNLWFVLGLIIRPGAVCRKLNCDLPQPFEIDTVPTELTLFSTVILEKLTVSYLVRKLSAICEALGLQKIVPLVPIPSQIIPFHLSCPVYLRSIAILVWGTPC